MTAGGGTPIQLEIQLLSGAKLTTLTVDRYWTGWELRTALRHMLRESQAVQKLLFGSQLIGKAQTVGELGLATGHVLQAVVAEEAEEHHGKDGKYQRIQLIGEGSAPFHDLVYFLRNTETHEYCVARQLDVSGMDRVERSCLVKEMIGWTQVRHPNLVRIQDVFRTKMGRLCMVMDFVDDGNLQDYLHRLGGLPVSMTTVLQHFCQLCLALDHVHAQVLVHGGLIPRHVLLSHSGQLKLGGLHIARTAPGIPSEDSIERLDMDRGRICPEVLNGAVYTAESDLFALGVVLFEMAALLPPFVADSFAKRLMLIRESRYTLPKRLQGSCLQPFIEQLLQKDACLRPTARSLLSRPPMPLAIVEVNRKYGLGIDLADIAVSPAPSKVPKLPELAKPVMPAAASAAGYVKAGGRPRIAPSLRQWQWRVKEA